MNKNLRVWWSDSPSPGNFGDMLTPLILQALGYTLTRVNFTDSYKFIAVGSILKFVKPGDIIWGSGIISKEDKIEKDATYLAVRGPLSGEKTGCNIFGDPGLLCSFLFPGKHEPENFIGLVPHYKDYLQFQTSFQELNILTKQPIDFIRKILKYEKIVSSSLHGIIVAHSYGIPAGWWKPSNNLSGDDIKFQDYALSTDIELVPNSDISKVTFTLPRAEKISNINNNLINALGKIL